MKVVCDPTHRLHAPRREFTRAGLTPYPESPDRVDAILAALPAERYERIGGREPTAAELEAVHRPEYVSFLRHAYPAWVAAGNPPEAVVAVVFPLRARARRPTSVADQVGYYCYDTTPIVEGTWAAALAAAGCALRAADLLLAGETAAYALCRPPGHHAGPDTCGGYCYLNNAALATDALSRAGRVAVLDIDYHHGNGTQQVFYARGDVLFASIHADPEAQYPFFWGRADETGEGAGSGLTRNFPLPAGTGDGTYLDSLDAALACVAQFEPRYLVVSAGADALDGDPLGDFRLSLEGFSAIGRRLATLGIPCLLVQEGGYALQRTGNAVAALLEPLG